MVNSLLDLLWRAENLLELLQMDESDLKRTVGIARSGMETYIYR